MNTYFVAAFLKPFAMLAMFGAAFVIGWPLRRYLKRTLPPESRLRRILFKRLY